MSASASSVDINLLRSKLKSQKKEVVPIKFKKRTYDDDEEHNQNQDILTTFVGTRTIYKPEEPRSYDYGLKFYYEDPNDFKDSDEGGLNLSNKHRPWYSFVMNRGPISGREAFNNALLYKPSLMEKYIYENYIEPFENHNRKSPFAFDKNYINSKKVSNESIVVKKKFILQPQQKFVGQFICNQTDFRGLIVFHELGAGKSYSAIVAGETNKSTGFILNREENAEETIAIPGRSIIDKTGTKHQCTITIVVPKSSIPQMFNEIVGHFQNDNADPISGTGSCVIYSEEEALDFAKNGLEYNGYRQFYVGRLKKSGGSVITDNGIPEYTWTHLNEYNKLLVSINDKVSKINEIDRILNDKDDPDRNIPLLQKRLSELVSDKKNLETKLIQHRNDLEKKVKTVYFIVSQKTFIRRIGQEIDIINETNETSKNETKNKKQPKNIKKKYTASKYVLGQSTFYGVDKDGFDKSKIQGSWIGQPPHPDCFHSEKSLLIFDEIHTNVKEVGSMHKRLFNLLYIYARLRSEDSIGIPAMKVILLTATPIFDNPYQIATMLNLLVPRLLFPIEKKVFDTLFINKKENLMKNSLLLGLMFSGYISYFKGGLPSSYPYRRNHTILHKMIGLQYVQYKEKLAKDVKNEFLNDPKLKEEYEKMKQATLGLNSVAADGHGKYPLARAASLSALPQLPKDAPILDDYYQVNNLYLELMSHRNNTDLLKKVFENYSAKLYWIGEKIMESSENDNEGPIFVYASLIARGLIPLMCYLEARGFSLFTLGDGMSNDLGKKDLKNNSKKFGIWGGEGFDHYKKRIGTDDQDEYRSYLQQKFNSPLNSSGSICKVMFGNVQESISFMQISQIHLCDPWWNIPKMEQILARGNRMFSHEGLPDNRKYIDVYYHLSILSSYPEIDPDIANTLRDVKNSVENRKTSLIGDPSKNNIQDLARSTVEQKVMSKARTKNELNIQFTILAKQTAVDKDLNKYGNICRLEEEIFSDISFKIDYERYTVLYNRPINKYYLYDKTSHKNELVEIKLNYQEDSRISWPAISYDIVKDSIVKPVKFSITIDNHNRDMTSVEVFEDLSNESLDKVKDMNFFELRDYAISHGEEESAWSVINDMRLKNNMMALTIGMYGLESADISSVNVKKLKQNIWSGLITNIGSNDLESMDRHKILERYLTSDKYVSEKQKLVSKLRSTKKNMDLDSMSLDQLKDLAKGS